MKIKFFIIFSVISILYQVSKAQSWTAVGPDDFNQLSYGSSAYSDIVFNNNIPYVVYRDNENSGKVTVKRLNSNGTGSSWNSRIFNWFRKLYKNDF